jgi:hypothetical protein
MPIVLELLILLNGLISLGSLAQQLGRRMPIVASGGRRRQAWTDIAAIGPLVKIP